MTQSASLTLGGARALGRLDDLNALQQAQDDEISNASLWLLKCEPDTTAWTPEPGRRNPRPYSDIGGRQKLVNIVLGAQRRRRE